MCFLHAEGVRGLSFFPSLRDVAWQDKKTVFELKLEHRFTLKNAIVNYELLELPGKTTGKACFPGAGANGVPTTIWFPPVFM